MFSLKLRNKFKQVHEGKLLKMPFSKIGSLKAMPATPLRGASIFSHFRLKQSFRAHRGNCEHWKAPPESLLVFWSNRKIQATLALVSRNFCYDPPLKHTQQFNTKLKMLKPGTKKNIHLDLSEEIGRGKDANPLL